MIKNSISLSIFLLAASLSLQAQIDSSKLNLDSIPFLELDLDISKLPASFDNFGTRKLDYSNRDRYQSKDFNPGIVSDPFLLLQGRVPGMQIYNRGGDPNVQSTARIRGLTTAIGQAQPLVIIDGVPNASIDQLDPIDIQEIKILKDGASAALYGIRANQGVVLITTKAANKYIGKFNVNFSGSTGIAKAIDGINILNAEEYLATGKGVNEGTATDWIDVIHRRAPAYIGNLAVSGVLKNIDYRVSANFRKVNGVLINSDFTKINTRANLNGKFLDEKLKINLTGGYTSLDQNFSYQEAVRFASVFNPTAPIFGKDALQAFNSEQYGGYFELLNVFNLYNPLSIVEQNQNIGKRNIFNISNLTSYAISDKTAVHMRLAHQMRNGYEREYNPTTSYFRGNANFPLNQGRAVFSNEDQSFSLGELFAVQSISGTSYDLKLTGGFVFQSDKLIRSTITTSGFSNDEIDLKDENSVNQKIAAAQEVQRTNNSIPVENTSAIYLSANAKFKDKYFIDANIRREGSSKLDKDNNWGTFFGLGLGMELMNNYKKASLQPRIGISRTGGVPIERGLTNDFVVEFTNSNGVLESRVQRAGNENLTWETKNELNVGLSFRNNKLNASLDWYNRNIKDIILSQFVDPAIFGAFTQFDNLMAVRSSGLELFTEVKVVENNKFSYTTNFVASTYETIVTKFRNETDFVGLFSGPGFGSTRAIRIKEGEPFGEIFGPVYKDVDASGEVIHEDINGDGQVIVNVNQSSDEIDFTVLGNALPKMEFGWNNAVRIGTFEISAFVRSAIGHSKINSSRIFHEVIFDQPSLYNYVRTELYNPGLKFARYNSAFIENASFVRLDNVRLSKSFLFDSDDFFTGLKVSIMGQNLYTWTKYTGTDPTPSIVDNLEFDNDLGEGTSLSPGFDRRVQYYPARTLSLLLQFNF